MPDALVAWRRYARQMRLADVGAEMQGRWLAAEARVEGEGVSANVEALYLAGAGIGVVHASPSAAKAARGLNADIRVDDSGTTIAVSDESVFADLDPAAAAVASGALRALRTLKAALSS